MTAEQNGRGPAHGIKIEWTTKVPGVLTSDGHSQRMVQDAVAIGFARCIVAGVKGRCDRFAVGLAGLPRVRDVLLESHESSLRLFDILDLERLSNDEVSQVIDRCLAKASENADRATTITQEGRAHLIALSEGYPHFIQQFGYSAFDQDTDYFGPGKQEWMINYRVKDLDAMLQQLREAGVEVIDRVDEYDYGRFGWAVDPEGNRLELWEPPTGA